MDIEQAAAGFLRHCAEERGLSENTLAAYQQDLREFRAFFSKIPIESVTGERLVAYASHLSGSRALAAATVKRRIACAKSMFAWLLRREGINANPFSKIDLRIRLPDRLPRCVPAADMAALAAASRSSCDLTRLVTFLLFSTGVRVGELASVRLADVGLIEGSIRIRGKGNRERLVYVTDETTRGLLREFIRTYRRNALETEPLLCAHGGISTTSARIRRHLRSLAARAGLKSRITPHMLRHTAATSLLESGVDMRFVQRLLGHRSIATTQIYTHVSDTALRAAIARADTVRQYLLKMPLPA